MNEFGLLDRTLRICPASRDLFFREIQSETRALTDVLDAARSSIEDHTFGALRNRGVDLFRALSPRLVARYERQFVAASELEFWRRLDELPAIVGHDMLPFQSDSEHIVVPRITGWSSRGDNRLVAVVEFTRIRRPDEPRPEKHTSVAEDDPSQTGLERFALIRAEDGRWLFDGKDFEYE